MNSNPSPNRARIQVEIPLSLRAVYSNFAVISHTSAEFFIDFAQLLPGLTKSQVHTRMVMSPTHAKLLLRHPGRKHRPLRNPAWC
ncbi:MAG: DUF3467 domain-containing protein, partial [Anaerolineae bacterium]|nr:DUF3467 domain-containing protein [Anaerolineae bacterium]